MDWISNRLELNKKRFVEDLSSPICGYSDPSTHSNNLRDLLLTKIVRTKYSEPIKDVYVITSNDSIKYFYSDKIFQMFSDDHLVAFDKVNLRIEFHDVASSIQFMTFEKMDVDCIPKDKIFVDLVDYVMYNSQIQKILINKFDHITFISIDPNIPQLFYEKVRRY